VIVGLYLVLVLEAAGRVRAALVSTLCAVMLGLYFLVLAFSGMRDFFELAVPNAGIILSALGGSALAIGGLWLTDDRFVPNLGPPKRKRPRRVAWGYDRDRSDDGPGRP
jgi:hypothetical protein